MAKKLSGTIGDLIRELRSESKGCYSESQLVVPALVVLSQHSKSINTSDLIGSLQTLLAPKGHDADIIPGRQDSYFSQKVRNLKSHDNLTKKRLATYKSGNWTITPKGLAFLKQNLSNLDAVLDQGIKVREVLKKEEVDFTEIIIEEGELQVKQSKQRRRSMKLKAIAIQRFKSEHGGKVFCVPCAFNFAEKYGEYGKDFIIIHHTVPIHTMDIAGTPTKLKKALKTVVPMCSNCHCMVHRKKRKMLSVPQLAKIIRNSSR